MKKIIILIGLSFMTLPMTTEAKDNVVEKALRNSILGKLLKNKANIDIVDTSKSFNRWVDQKPAYTIKSKKRELKDCMGKNKVISNETINCYYGTE